MTVLRRIFQRWRPGMWRWVQALHHIDFAWVLPAMARLPLAWGYRLAEWRGRLNARTGRDWRSMALGMRHIQRQALAGYHLLPVPASDAQRLRWSRERFVVEARDEFEARLTAAGRLAALRTWNRVASATWSSATSARNCRGSISPVRAADARAKSTRAIRDSGDSQAES